MGRFVLKVKALYSNLILPAVKATEHFYQTLVTLYKTLLEQGLLFRKSFNSFGRKCVQESAIFRLSEPAELFMDAISNRVGRKSLLCSLLA